jgi:hypothetical protein
VTSARRLFKGNTTDMGNGNHLDRVGDPTSEPLQISGCGTCDRVDWQAIPTPVLTTGTSKPCNSLLPDGPRAQPRSQ